MCFNLLQFLIWRLCTLRQRKVTRVLLGNIPDHTANTIATNPCRKVCVRMLLVYVATQCGTTDICLFIKNPFSQAKVMDLYC